MWNELVAEFVAGKEARRDEQTTDWYRARLRHWVEFAQERELTPAAVRSTHLDAFFGLLKRARYAYNTRMGTLTALKAFFKWLAKRKLIKQNPFTEFEPLTKERSEMQPIPLPFAYRMIHEAETDGSPYGIRDAAIMRLLLTTGIRREEVVRLRLDQVYLDLGQALLRGKFDHQRRAPLKSTTATALRRWLAARPPTRSEVVFVSLHPDRQGVYQAMRPDAINDVLVKWRDRAGLPKVSCSPHKWRHRFATEMKRAGDPFSLQQLLGHQDIASTRIYAHTSPEELLDLVERFGPDVPLIDE